MKQRRFLPIVLCCAMLLSATACKQTPPPQPTEPTKTHEHTFGEWVFQEAASCRSDGREDRRCADCGFTESRLIPRLAHTPGNYGICKACQYVDFDKDAPLVELGIVCDSWYQSGSIATYAWDTKIWNGKVYRGAGDYGENSGAVVITAYNIEAQCWEICGSVADQAVHSFEEIGGTLYIPGIDPTGGWQLGNYYVLEKNGTWSQVRTLPNGIHNFDMIEFDGKLFAGLGTEVTGNTVAVSADGGKTFEFVPLYKDGAPHPLSGYKSSRTYEFVEFNDTLYALVRFTMGIGGVWELFRYEDGKMHYVANGFDLLGTGVSRKYFSGEFEFNGACYIASGGLTVVTDFSDPETWKKVEMPGKEVVVDAFLRDGVIYVLTSSPNRNPNTHNVDNYNTVIYKSTTGAEGSFQEVLRFAYDSSPLTFDWDGTYFYIGTGYSAKKEKTGMLLRAKPSA